MSWTKRHRFWVTVFLLFLLSVLVSIATGNPLFSLWVGRLIGVAIAIRCVGWLFHRFESEHQETKGVNNGRG